MYQIIDAIFSSPLKKNLAFKWGTLCYFLHNLPRFSTDLDFDLIEDTPDIMDTLQAILKKFGNIKDMHNKKFTYFFLFDYGTGNHNIKIEISKKIYNNNTYKNISFFGKNITAMDKESIFTNKLIALSERYTNRDIFDVHFFFTNHYPINEKLIKERTGWSYKQLLLTIKKELPKKYKASTILAEIGDLITPKQKEFMKTKLITQTINFIDFTLFSINNPLK